MIFKSSLYPKWIVLIIVVLTSFASQSVLAQCVISSNDHACVDEPLSFEIQSSSTVSSVAWNFGDGLTSSMNKPFHRYTKAGTYDVRASVVFSGGGKCDTTKKITVYNAPDANVSIKSSNKYCLTENIVCIIDSPTSGNSTTNISDRSVLWGDGGKTDTKWPVIGSEVCYKYKREGNYTLTVELTNDKGCKTKQEVKLEVLKDFIPKFTNYQHSQGCDTITQVIKLDPSWVNEVNLLDSAILDFDDGNTLFLTNFDSVFYTFRNTKVYKVAIILYFKNGCVTRYQKDIDIQLDRIVINHSKRDSVLCWPEHFRFEQAEVKGATARYTWSIYNLEKKLIKSFGGGNNAFLFPDTPGKYYIGLEIKRNDCVSTMMFDSVESVGVQVRTKLFNSSQCEAKDTVYFCNKTRSHRTNDVRYLWKFLDPVGDACTTNTAKGLNVNKNCNFSEDENAKHFYTETKCDDTWLVAHDVQNGCKDSIKFNVIIGKPDLSDFVFKPKKTCIGSRPGYGVEFELESCFGELSLNLDSACGIDSFVDWQDQSTYLATCDTSRWITLGLAANTGDAKVYRSCDTADYYIDSNRICNDTLWIHNAFRLDKAPFPQFSYKFDGCIPSIMTGSIFVRQQPNVRKMYFDWDDGQYDTIDIPRGTDSLPDFQHVFRRSGVYLPKVTLETDSGCQEDQRIFRSVGFYNNFEFDDLVCPGMSVFFKDTITYWEDTTQYWRITGVPEKVFWDWDGAIGPNTGTEISAKFIDTGTYNIRMISIDKKGCADTLIKPLVVSKVLAGIREITKKILCEDILQLFDSSFALPNPRDSLTQYYWGFGDGKTPSYLKDPYHYYSTYGTFEVTHIVENTIGCKDTTTTYITIEGPDPQFDIISDTVGCAPFTAEFKNNSERATEFIWYFGDLASSSNTLSTNSDTNVSFTYTRPGTYYIYLFAGDSVVNPDQGNKIYYCNSTFPDTNALRPAIRRITVLPKPKVDFDFSGTVCLNSTLTLTDRSDTIYSYYRWFYGMDSTTGSNNVQQIEVLDTGSLTITYKPTYVPNGPYQRACFDSITKKIPVLGYEIDFDFEKDELCPLYYFKALVQPEVDLVWDFGHPNSGDENQSNERETSHTFAPDFGDFLVCVKATSPEGCIDTACKTVDSDHEFSIFIPNIITPNDDGLNDFFDIEIDGEDLYELDIYNRWGERMYSVRQDSDNLGGGNWDGKEQNSGTLCPPGTYFYIFRFREGCNPAADVEDYSGIITVIR